MKKLSLILLCAIIVGNLQAQKCKILYQNKESITFQVDKNLPEPQYTRYLLPEKEPAKKILEYLGRSSTDNIIATSIGTPLYIEGNDTFFRMMVNAYADHHGIELSPDVIWLLISQGLAHQIKEEPEKYHDIIARCQGKEKLTVITTQGDITLPSYWEGVVNELSNQIEQNTNTDFAKLITSDFSTTGFVERIASEITLMDATQWFFSFEVINITCGIPHITLKGTPADWKHLIEKTKALESFGLKWWVDDLIPILKEFANASKGKPRSIFWKNIVCKDRPYRLRGNGCSGDGATKIDGWFLKLMPFDLKGRTPAFVSKDHQMYPQIVQVPFCFTECKSDNTTNTDMELWSGIMGYKENPDTHDFVPQIGWIVVNSSSEKR